MKKIATSILVIAFISCNQQAQKPQAPKKETMMVKDAAKKELKQLAFASKTDLVCGMPVSAGVSDTASYKEKLYGFCAQECKEEFLKAPNQYLTAK